jgi:hypothetical protein
MRVGQKQKKIDIQIPKLDDFIHRCYINVARKIYKNVYLFENNIAPLQVQKHNRELEILIQEAILNTLRESIPVESILKAYMDETVEEDVTEEIKEQIIEEPKKEIKENENILKDTNTIVSHDIKTELGLPASSSSISNTNINTNALSFNDIDYVRDENNNELNVNAPKTIERLEEISEMRNIQRKQEMDEDDANEKLQISGESVDLTSLDIHEFEEPTMKLLPDLLIDDIEILE